MAPALIREKIAVVIDERVLDFLGIHPNPDQQDTSRIQEQIQNGIAALGHRADFLDPDLIVSYPDFLRYLHNPGVHLTGSVSTSPYAP